MYSRDPPCQILPLLPGYHESSLLNHIPELGLAWELLDAFHQILVTAPIPRNQLPYQRYSSKTPSLVDSIEEGVIDLAEFKACEDSTGFEDTEGFMKGGLLVCEVADAEGDSVEVDGVAGDGGEFLCVGF